MHFSMENLKMNRRRTKNFLTFLRRDSNPRFSVIFLLMIWIFMEGESDEIKSRNGMQWTFHYILLRADSLIGLHHNSNNPFKWRSQCVQSLFLVIYNFFLWSSFLSKNKKEFNIDATWSHCVELFQGSKMMHFSTLTLLKKGLISSLFEA